MSEMMLLVDAYSQMFRCFYAVRYLSNSQGEPTNALLPFVRILLALNRDYPAASGAFVFDCGRVAFRQELNPAYKATRPPMPEELKVQIPPMRDFAAAFGWPLLEQKEYEADDLIGAIAVNAACPVGIISSDKDLSQLIDDRIFMLLPGAKGVWEMRDRAAVEAKFQVKPEQIIDYLAILGDNADNIPGVPGMGAKTAAKLLAEYGSLQEMLAHPENIANAKQRDVLLANRDLLVRNCKLIALRLDLPEHLADLNAVCRREAPDWARIRELCRRWELASILRELPPENDAASAKAPASYQAELF